MTPDQFQTEATAWIGSAVVVVGLLATALVKILPAIATLKEQIKGLQSTADTHTQQINTIALATPPATVSQTPQSKTP